MLFDITDFSVVIIMISIPVEGYYNDMHPIVEATVDFLNRNLSNHCFVVDMTSYVARGEYIPAVLSLPGGRIHLEVDDDIIGMSMVIYNCTDPAIRYNIPISDPKMLDRVLTVVRANIPLIENKSKLFVNTPPNGTIMHQQPYP